jgi:hypothetical protein
MLQHYLVSISNSKNGKDNDLKMINISSYIAKYWKGDKLLGYLLHEKGGDSKKFLKEINRHIDGFSYNSFILPNPTFFQSRFDQKCNEIAEKLRLAPMLVTDFEVDDNFLRGGISFLEPNTLRTLPPRKTEYGRHSMLLIGARKDDNKWIFLLQNWWQSRFFVEVSAEYMSKSGAMIVEVLSEITFIPQDFPVVYSTYVETSVDTAEQMNDEI